MSETIDNDITQSDDEKRAISRIKYIDQVVQAVYEDRIQSLEMGLRLAKIRIAELEIESRVAEKRRREASN